MIVVLQRSHILSLFIRLKPKYLKRGALLYPHVELALSPVDASVHAFSKAERVKIAYSSFEGI